MSRTGRPALSAKGLDALEQFEQYLRKQDLSPPTLRNYVSDLRQFIAWSEEEVALDHTFSPNAVDAGVIIRYQTYLDADLHLKPATRNRYLSSVKRYFAWAVDHGLIDRDPAKAIKLVDQAAHAPRGLTDQEERALVAAVTGHGSLRDQALIILMLETGLRVQEVLELQCADLLPGPLLRVHGPRGKERTVPISSAAWAALAPYVATLDPGTRYLFPSEKTEGPLTERALGYLLHKYTDPVGLHDLSPHCLRHHFGYRNAGKMPVLRLAELMGHDSLDTTMVYLRRAME